jgi:uncharacterized protein YrzB (UPF0473 family)
MNEELGSDFIVITDEDGNDYELEHIDTIEIDDTFYMAFLPADMDEEDDDFGMIILKTITENGEDTLATVDDDALLEDIYSRFMERME